MCFIPNKKVGGTTVAPQMLQNATPPSHVDDLTNLLASLSPEVLAAIVADPTTLLKTEPMFPMHEQEQYQPEVYQFPSQPIFDQAFTNFEPVLAQDGPMFDEEADSGSSVRCLSEGTLVKEDSPEYSPQKKSTLPVKQRKRKEVPDELALKRQKNTEAARRSRMRKVLKMEQLSQECETLQRKVDELNAKVSQYEARFGPL